jgi:hypothetical protein
MSPPIPASFAEEVQREVLEFSGFSALRTDWQNPALA